MGRLKEYWHNQQQIDHDHKEQGMIFIDLFFPWLAPVKENREQSVLQDHDKKVDSGTLAKPIPSLLIGSNGIWIGDEIVGLIVVQIRPHLPCTQNEAIAPKDQMILYPHEVRIRQELRELLDRFAESEIERNRKGGGKISVDLVGGSQLADIGQQDKGSGDVDKIDDAVILRQLYNLPLRVDTLAEDIDYLRQVLYGKGSAVKCIATTYSHSHICILNGDEIIRAVTHHPYLQGAFPEDPLPKRPSLYLTRYYLLVSSDDQTLVLGSYPSKHFYAAMEEGLRVVINEIVIDRINGVLLTITETEVLDKPLALNYLATWQDFNLSDLNSPTTTAELSTLQNYHLDPNGDHACHEGGLHSYKDVVTCDNLSIDLALCEGSDCTRSIFLQHIHEGSHTQNADAFQKGLPVSLKQKGRLFLGYLSAAKSNAPKALQRELFDEGIKSLDFCLRVTVDHLRTALCDHEVATGLVPIEGRHRLKPRFILVDSEHLQEPISYLDLSNHLCIFARRVNYLSLHMMEHLQIYLIAVIVSPYLFHGVTASKQVCNQRMSCQIATNTKKLALSCSEYRSYFHGAISERACLIKANCFCVRYFKGLLGFSTIYAILVQAYQTEGIGEVEEDRKRSGQAIGDELQELEKHHNVFYATTHHLLYYASIEKQAYQQNFHHEIDQLVQQLGLIWPFCQDLSNDSSSA